MGEEADADWEAGMAEAGREYVENDIRDKMYRAGHPVRRRRLVMEEGCMTCAELARGSFGPSHDPSPRCESGKRPHCTCDTCF